MSSSGRKALAIANMTICCFAMLTGPAAAQANCDWYAQTALKQQQENERLQCGFTGPAWTSDLQGHQAWCGNVAPDQMKSEAQAREAQIKACAEKQ
jgi:hypothetical protein